MNRTVLVIGPDLGFVFWLCRALDQAGYDAFPARGAGAAAETVSDFHLSPGLVILTASMLGSYELIAHLKELEDVRVLRLAEPGNGNRVAADKVYPHPAEMTAEARSELLKAVSAVLVDNPIPADNSR